MSFRNAYYNRRTNTMHLWHTIKGERFYDEIPWVPFLFVPTNESDIHYLDGTPVKRLDFDRFSDYSEFQKGNHKFFENSVKPEIQFLTERYYGIKDDDLEVPPLKIFTVDIEVHSGSIDGTKFSTGFPHPKDAACPIVLISVHDSFTNKIHTWGIKEYQGKKPENYYHYKTEESLLMGFFRWMNQQKPDVITGWNIQNFDMPYFYNRCKRLFGDDAHHVFSLLSPIRITSAWDREDEGLNIDIAGVSILDYMYVYKEYTPHNLESYSLGFVSKFELEKGKLDYSQYKDLRTLYVENWDLYVDYNRIDVLRPYQLECKLKYIRLIQMLSLISKCPMKFYDKVTSIIEGVFLTYYRRKKLCAPKFVLGKKSRYPAAIVKQPVPGKYRYIVDLDVTSEYPHMMIALNMGVESFYGQILGPLDRDDERNFDGLVLSAKYQSVNQDDDEDEEDSKTTFYSFTEQEMITWVRERKLPPFRMIRLNVDPFGRFDQSVEVKDSALVAFNRALQRGLLCISPNGTIFRTDRLGEICEVEKELFLKRDSTKKKMKDLKINKGDVEQIAILHAQQMAIKKILNSIYGALATPSYRSFNLNIAKSITSTGRHTLLRGEQYANEIMNDPSKSFKLVSLLEELKSK